MSDFEDWFQTNGDKIVTFTYKQICEHVWNEALNHNETKQKPFAWATVEEAPRFISNKTKTTSLFKSAVESFIIPLYKK